MQKRKIPYLLLLLLIFSCKKENANDNLLALALSSSHPNIKKVMDNIDAYEVQIRYTKIDRIQDSVIFTDYDFQVNSNNYFYPASSVKFPIAVLALERLNQTDTIGLNTRYYVEGDSIESTFAEDIIKIFTISDNMANNRLVELLGQDAINNNLAKKGIKPVRIAHRLGYHSEDLVTKPLIIYLNDSTTGITTPSLNTSPKPLELDRIKKGKGYIEENLLIEQPFDFSLKNYLPITAQHEVLKRVIFPNLFHKEERFKITEGQHQFLLNAMQTLPKNAGYDPDEFYDGYCKFFMFGDTKENIPGHIKIYNKVGFAYGTLTDIAYITDTLNNVDFMLSATILVNTNGIFNDNVYEYDEIGIPFLAELGREIYTLELKRKKLR
ncbi:serine hydrolase [Maribacter sp. CXY002]|uniref:serine hydrolase n=1 Tax=Maribacter luteocoastalis TaxID=3407671 RepID=UPI003B683E9D